jgi:hypothetical protein
VNADDRRAQTGASNRVDVIARHGAGADEGYAERH